MVYPVEFLSVICRVRILNLGWHFFASKVAFSWPPVDRFGEKIGTYYLRPSYKCNKFLLIWSTESWETQLLKGKKCQHQLHFRTLVIWVLLYIRSTPLTRWTKSWRKCGCARWTASSRRSPCCGPRWWSRTVRGPTHRDELYKNRSSGKTDSQ